MPEERHRSLLGPILLILVGIGLLLNQMGLWSVRWENLLPYWPILLVLVGLDILLSRSRLGRLALFVVVIVGLVALAVTRPGLLTTADRLERRTLEYPAESVEQADLRLQTGVGRLELRGLDDEGQLYVATVAYDPKRSSLIDEVEKNDSTVRLRLGSEYQSWTTLGGDNLDRWDVELNETIPWTIRVEGGVGSSEFDLRKLLLEQLDLQVGVGRIDLRLPETGTYQADVKGGVGSLTVQVPRGVPVLVRVSGGLGSTEAAEDLIKDGSTYATAEYQPGEPAIELVIEAGVGTIRID